MRDAIDSGYSRHPARVAPVIGTITPGGLPLPSGNMSNQFRQVPGSSKRVVSSIAHLAEPFGALLLDQHASLRDDECQSGAALPL